MTDAEYQQEKDEILQKIMDQYEVDLFGMMETLVKLDYELKEADND